MVTANWRGCEGGLATEITSFASLDSYVRDCKDALVGEYEKAKAEWKQIDEKLLKWIAGGAAVTAGMVSGHVVPDVVPLSAATVSILGQLGLRYFRRQQFRNANPMSVLIDLSRKEPPGLNLY